MNRINFTIPGPPKGKQRARTLKTGFSYTPKETVQYENLVKTCCQTVMSCPPMQEMVQVGVLAYYPIPKSASKKKRADMESGKLRPIVKPDLDNIMKVVCDALNQIAYRDDSQIVAAYLAKMYSGTPRVEVEIIEVNGLASVVEEK